ncbi:hypothetical protein [Cohnella terricola]|uniref:Uncharacterized protein n=1 Tax=Cohnella terricola TaxID=1289167 RepID=A0A559J5L6_9BACL|nr:hypothetical protein [Cohnella terricola]TVX95188.1 hypothetical protein FPZ45_23900 [Cohnella terricola]
MENHGYELTLKFDLGENSLYDLGYLSIDIYHLIVFSELLERRDSEGIDMVYNSSRVKSRFPLTREDNVLKNFRNKAIIKSVRNGSIELTIAGLSLISSIIVPFIIYKLQKRDLRSDQNYLFEVNANDRDLNHIIDSFRDGYYGRGPSSINWLFDILSRNGYDISFGGTDQFVIRKVLERYENRIIKIVEKR